MKDFIFKNYGIKVNQLYFKKQKYFFYVSNQQVKIVETEKDDATLNHLFEITNYLYNNNIKINTFLVNNYGNCYTARNKKNIVLLKENNYGDKITLEYVEKFSKIENYLIEYNLENEWKSEVDRIERAIIEYNKEYPIIQNSINYYIGLAENAIALINNVNIVKYRNKLTIGHKISYEEYDVSYFDNPFCLIKTHSMYDIANYFKYNFYKNTINYDELDDILFRGLDEDDKIIFFANLLYPNYYFECTMSILNGEKSLSEKNIEKNFIKMTKNYENFLLYCKIRLKNVNLLNLISWIDE